MEKTDLKKEFKELYTGSDKVTFVDVPEIGFLMVDGKGEPENNPAYQQAIEGLYGTAYTMKFMLKPKKEFTVMPLESLWWMEGGWDPKRPGKDWRWTALMAVPDFIKKSDVDTAIKKLKERKNPAVVPKFERFKEGKCVQMMHIGPYNEVGRSIGKMQAYAKENGYDLTGKHHEIYFSDPRRVAPEKLKTLLRHPVKKV